MTQEQFECALQCNNHIEKLKRARALLDCSDMIMFCEWGKGDTDLLKGLYIDLIDWKEREKITLEYRAKMTALIDEEINRSKEEFEKI